MQFLKMAYVPFLIIFSLSFMPVSVSAADLSFSAGGGLWRSEGSGELRYEDNPAVDVDILDYDKETRGYVWAELRHPTPFLPNLRIEYANVKFSGRSSESYVWDGTVYEADSYSETKIIQLDMIAFYNILSLPWVDLDFGVDVKYIDFEFDAEGEGRSLDDPTLSDGISEHEDETFYAPFVYSKVRFDIPASNFGIEGEVKYTQYKGSNVLDSSIKADYLFNFKLCQFGVEAGYRYESIDVDEDDFSGLTFDVDVDIKGPFAGIVFKY